MIAWLQNTDNSLLIALALVSALLMAVVCLISVLRSNTKAVRSCNRQASLAFAADVYASIIEDPLLCSIFRSGLNDIESLTEPEKIRMHYFLHNTLLLFRDSYNAYQEKVINEEEYESNRAALMAVLRMPGGKAWWLDAQNAYPQDIKAELDLRSDVCYSLGDIFPYFIIGSEELAHAANDEAFIDQFDKPKKIDWRQGRVRRRARQNFTSR